MIVVDENIHSDSVIGAITAWYTGQVVSITDLRPATLIKDDGIATVLRRANAPTFITINVSDFWLTIPPANQYCIIGFVLPQDQTVQIPSQLRNLLRLPEFRSKSARMGKIVRVRPSRVEYYDRSRLLQIIALPA